VLPASGAARYHRAGAADPTQYLALHPLGPLAELMRAGDLRRPEQLRHVSTRTWALDTEIDGLVEIDFDNAESFGLAADELVGDDWGACQRLADDLRGQGQPGLIVPSAALPGTRNVVLLGARVAAPYLAQVPSRLDIPASITAEDGRPLASLTEIVRFRGEPHAALAAWERGESFRFSEPDWSLDAAA
jgi:RES domain-containing protein